MSNVNLTKEADALICILYKEYLHKMELGLSTDDAQRFGGSIHIHDTLLSQWSYNDVDKACQELDRADFLCC